MNLHEGRATMTTHASGYGRSPAHLSFACLLNGVEPVALDKPFTYFAFGAGSLAQLSELAANAPLGRFYAATSPFSGAAASRTASADAGPSNLTLLPYSAAELAQGVAGLPKFDFIVTPDDYDAIAAESRQHVAGFIARHLEPGGIVHAGYNAMPGAAASHPLQRLLLQYRALHAQAAEGAHADAHASVQALADNGAKYFDANPGMHALWNELKAHPADRMSAMAPLYFADVARGFAAAKLDFVAGADPRVAAVPCYLTLQQQGFLDNVADLVLRETFKDYICNTAYRSDVFVRGARRMHPVRRLHWLERSGLALNQARGHHAPQALGRTVLDALAERPFTLAELAALPALQGAELADLLDTAALLVAAGQTVPFFTSGARSAPPQAVRHPCKQTEEEEIQ